MNCVGRNLEKKRDEEVMRFPGIDHLTITYSSDQMVDIYCSILLPFSNCKNKITQYLGKKCSKFFYVLNKPSENCFQNGKFSPNLVTLTNTTALFSFIIFVEFIIVCIERNSVKGVRFVQLTVSCGHPWYNGLPSERDTR